MLGIPCQTERCPHCSFSPESESDFCDKHKSPPKNKLIVNNPNWKEKLRRKGTGPWVVSVKGDRRAFAISLCRKGNGHGLEYYGWFDKDKLMVCESQSVRVHQRVFEALCELAARECIRLNETPS